MKTLTTETIADTLRGVFDVVVLDFWAAWCGPCGRLSDVVSQVEEEIPVIFYKINVDENVELAREYNVMSIPTLVVLKGGSEVKRLVGARTREELIKDLSDLL